MQIAATIETGPYPVDIYVNTKVFSLVSISDENRKHQHTTIVLRGSCFVCRVVFVVVFQIAF
jgi:hypothetical protein